MVGHRQVEQAALFYEFSLERHIPADHWLRSIDRFIELGGLRRELAPFYSSMGRPSIDPELMIRILIVGYCFGIRATRRARSRSHGKGAPRVDCARRSRCCSRTSSAFSSSTDYDCAGRTVRVTSSSSQQPPRTFESLRN